MKRKISGMILLVLLVLSMTAGMGRVSEVRAAEVYYNQILNVVVSTSEGSCNFRMGPGLEYGVMQTIGNGTSLMVTALSRNAKDGLVWGQAVYNGIAGWVSIRTTWVYDIQGASGACYDVRVTVPEYLYLRQGPGAEFPVLGKPAEGQYLRIDRTIVNHFDGRPWGRTTYNGIQGWISLNWTYRDSSMVYQQAKDVYMTDNQYYAVIELYDSATYFMEGPGLSSQMISWIPNGIPLYVDRTLDNSRDGWVWGEVQYNNRLGWIPMNHTRITEVEGAADVQYSVCVENAANLRLRSGPGTEYAELVSYIPNGTWLYITQTMINSFDGRPWGRTFYNGVQGWVSLNWTYRAPGT